MLASDPSLVSTLRALALAAPLVLLACNNTADDASSDDGTSSSETSSDTDGDTKESEPDEPVPCEVLDCEDPECADRFECNWPAEIVVRSEVQFTGRTIRCRLGQTDIRIDVDVPNCTTRLRAEITELAGTGPCAGCDKVYRGPITYAEDSCSEALGQDAPDEGTWGIKFLSEDEREIWGENADGEWEPQATLSLADGVFTHTITEAVELDTEKCNNGLQYLGDLAVSTSYRDVRGPSDTDE